MQEHWQRVVGTTAIGGYIFQHGLAGAKPEGGRDYILDFDFFKEEVPLADTIELVQKLHDSELSMFSWAIGDKARQHLGPSTV